MTAVGGGFFYDGWWWVSIVVLSDCGGWPIGVVGLVTVVLRWFMVSLCGGCSMVIIVAVDGFGWLGWVVVTSMRVNLGGRCINSFKSSNALLFEINELCSNDGNVELIAIIDKELPTSNLASIVSKP